MREQHLDVHFRVAGFRGATCIAKLAKGKGLMM